MVEVGRREAFSGFTGVAAPGPDKLPQRAEPLLQGGSDVRERQGMAVMVNSFKLVGSMPIL